MKTGIYILFAIPFLVLANCTDARIRFPAPAAVVEEPKECKPPVKNQKACDTAMEKAKKAMDAKLADQKEEEKIVKIEFKMWGFKPEVELKAKELCPGRIKEIYQYSTSSDIIAEFKTLGYIIPKTLKVTCVM